MRSVAFTVVLLVSVLLLSNTKSYAQAKDDPDCPPVAKASDGQRKALLMIMEKYSAALKSKDWDAAMKLTGDWRVGAHPTLSLMRDLLQPLEIERLSFDENTMSLKPCEALLRYQLSLRAVDPQTRKPVIDVTGLPKSAHWIRVKCGFCPPDNLTPWLLVGDAADAGETLKALAEAKSPVEQRLVLIDKDSDELKELALTLARRGYDFFKQRRDAEASAAFALSQMVISQIRYHTVVWKRSLLELTEQMLAEHKKEDGPDVLGQILYTRGELYSALGEHAKALKSFEDSLRLLDAGVGETSADAYASTAAVYRNQGDYERAIDFFLKSLERYKLLAMAQRGTGSDIAAAIPEVLVNLAFLYEVLGREEQARGMYDEMRSIIKEGGDSEALYLLLALGVMKMVKGEVAEGIEYLERASVVSARVMPEDKNQVSYVMSLLLVDPYLRRKDYVQAAKHIVRAKEATKSLKENYSLVLLIEEMLYTSQGEEQLATLRAEQYQAASDDRFLKGADGSEPGAGVAVSRSAKDSNDGFHIAMQALDVLLATFIEKSPGKGDASSVKDVLTAAALERLRRGTPEDLKSARELFARVLAIGEAAGDELIIAEAHAWVAQTYNAEGAYLQAIDNHHKSIQVMERARLPLASKLVEFELSYITEWRNIALLQFAMGDYQQALASYQKILGRNGRFYKLLDTTLHYEVAKINFRMGRYEEVLSSINRALQAASGGGGQDRLWELYTLAGQAHHALKQDAAAALSFAEAIKEIEASRSRVVGGGRVAARYFEDKVAPYHEMISMLAEQGKCAEALAYAERSKSRVLLDILTRGGVSSHPLTTAERRMERALRARMFIADREYAAAQDEQHDGPRAAQLRVTRLQERLEYESFRIGLLLPSAEGIVPPVDPPRFIDPAEIARLLPPSGGALLEFAVTGDKTYLFVMTDGGAETVGASAPMVRCEVHAVPVDAKRLMDRVAEFSQRIANPQGVVRPLARELYDLLLKPAQTSLRGRASLVIVPDGNLWKLPFQALQADDGRFLLQESTISYVPSLTSLREMRKAEAKRASRADRPSASSATRPLRLFAMANPAGSLPPLPGTEALAYKLAKLYGPAQSRVYVGENASESRVKKEARGFDIIHISAHGFLDDDAMYSRVKLSRAEDAPAVGPRSKALAVGSAEDGMLEAWEIMDLKLDADLIVLSACETARGRVDNGEGVMGLSWALFTAGVPASVVSQWTVDEGATSELMYLFHKNLLKGWRAEPARLHKADSLRRASLELLGSPRYAHPYYWAGFILVGDSR